MMSDVLVCPICGEIVKKEDLQIFQNVIDNSCPCCGHCLENAVKCCECGQWVVKETTHNDMCEDCLEKFISTEIIVEYVRKYHYETEWQEHLKKFVMEDPDEFVEFLKGVFNIC